MSELISEVEEAMRRERLEHIWKTYGNYIIGMIMVVVLGTGFYSAYSGWLNNHNAKQTTQLVEAEAMADPAKLIEVAANLDPALRTIGELRAAGQYIARNQPELALPVYRNITVQDKAPVELKDLAHFMTAKLTAKENADEALKTLDSIASNEKSVMRYHARLESALILAHQKQDFKGARQQLDVILSADKIPQSLTTKANALNILYRLQDKS